MSLILWLPLQGTLENKGISDIVVDGHSSTVDTAHGKLALSCQKFARSTSQYLSFPAFLSADSEFTYCCWFNTSSLDQTQCLFSQRTAAAVTGFSIFYMGASTDEIRFDDGASLSSSGTISTANQWYHIAVVRTATNKYIYINGTLRGSGARNNPTKVNTNYALIGGSQGNATAVPTDNALNGYLQDVRIYDHALSAAEIRELARGLTLHYKLNGNYELEQSLNIPDSSGYERHGTMIGTRETANDSARYAQCEYITLGTTQYIQTPTLTFNPKDVTLNIWFKSSSKTPTGNYHMVVDSVANRQAYEMCVYKSGYFRAGLIVNGVRYADNCSHNTTMLNGNWHMLTLTYDEATVKRYIDGVLGSSTTVSFSSGLMTTTALAIGRDGPSASYACKEANLSDFRIYATALSAEDIKELYQTAMKIDDLGNTHPYEVVEDTGNKILKNGQLLVSNVVENDYMQYLKYDHNIYFEPDGSAWVHIYHHNSPYDNGVFTHLDGNKVSMDEFDEGIYLDEHRWLDMKICNYVNTWEILTVRRFSSANDFVVNRWVQPANPTTAAYADVTNANLTKRTTGYTTSMNASGNYSNYSYAGYYRNTLSGQQSYILASNKSNTWYGAIGARQYWHAASKDTTGFNSTGNAITTGSVDLYLRIDNVTFTTPTKAKVTEFGTWSTHEIIEC